MTVTSTSLAKEVMANCLVVVPARLESQRLPRKPLVMVSGLPLVVRTVRNLNWLHKLGAQIVVATDSQEILNCCSKYNIKAELTDINHKSGTDRVFEIAQKKNRSTILNVQGDEPFLAQQDLESLFNVFANHLNSKSTNSQKTQDLVDNGFLATLVYPSSDKDDFLKPSVVKAVCSSEGKALYFSRAPIPHLRDQASEQECHFLHHMGVYLYSMSALKKFCQCPPSHLESIEKLEQLRALENGIPIITAKAESYSCGIDTPEDLAKAESMFKNFTQPSRPEAT